VDLAIPGVDIGEDCRGDSWKRVHFLADHLALPWARETGATVIVPIYPLVPQGGTAGTVVPTVMDLISSQIDQHGAKNVSVYGDSLGGTIGLAAVQELVRRGEPVPSHMVLISPALDLTFSNPAIQFVDGTNSSNSAEPLFLKSFAALSEAMEP